MAALKNPKHEAFAQRMAASNDAVSWREYKKLHRCSDKAAKSNATRWMDNDGIRARIDELQRKVADKFTLTRVTWLERLLRVADKAEGNGDYAATRGCLREIGLAMPGWYSPEKQDIDGKLEIVIRKL